MVKVVKSESIVQFFRRCEVNLNRQDKNKFLGMRVTQSNEKQVQSKLKKAGFQEFGEDETQWPSLLISSQEFKKSPYHSAIHLENIADQHFTYRKEILPANQLFNVEAIQMDRNQELNDWMKLRALDEPIEAAVLWLDNEVWMLDAPSEANTIDPCAKKAKGDVCTFGLGIGYFIYMAMINPEVTSITVIESSSQVIEMFQKYLLPQFLTHIPVTIIQGDAYAHFNEAFLSTFDYVFVDIHQSNDDGLKVMEKMLTSYCPPLEQVDFWIEDSCVEILPALIFHYLKSVANQKKWTHPNPYVNGLLQKIHRYMSYVDIEIKTVDQMKFYMYDRLTLRKILGRQTP